MKFTISFISSKHYSLDTVTQWLWYYKPYKFVKGIVFRIFGIHFNIRESKATEKLIKLWDEKKAKNKKYF